MESTINHSIHLSSARRNFITSPIKPFTTKEKAMKILQEFSNETTLLGVSHYLRSKNIVWLIAYLCCLATSIAQSWSAANDFFTNKGRQNYVISSRTNLTFPSVTVCSYAVIENNFDFNLISGYNATFKSINKCNHSESIDDDIFEEIRSANDRALLKYLRSLNNSERAKHSVDFKSMFQSCKFREQPCDYDDTSLFYFFNNPFYGNCFTFNAAFNSSTALEVDMRTKLSMIFKMNTSSYVKIGSSNKTKIGLLLHTPGTAPVLESSAVADLFPGQSVEFVLRLSVKKFEPKMSTNCIERDEKEHQTKSKFYFPQTPYLYSMDACMKTCEQNNIIKECNKIDAIMPVQKDESAISDVLVPPFADGCDNVSTQQLDMENCSCRLPCNYIQYIVNSDTTPFSEECDAQKKPKTERIKFSINFLSSVVEEVNEVPEYNLSQFLGILGGNLSLWIGLCVVSLLELIELAYKLLGIMLCSKNASSIKRIKKKTVTLKSFTNILSKL